MTYGDKTRSDGVSCVPETLLGRVTPLGCPLCLLLILPDVQDGGCGLVGGVTADQGEDDSDQVGKGGHCD